MKNRAVATVEVESGGSIRMNQKRVESMHSAPGLGIIFWILTTSQTISLLIITCTIWQIPCAEIVYVKAQIKLDAGHRNAPSTSEYFHVKNHLK